MNGEQPIKTILILAANPNGSVLRRLDQEVREIKDGLQRSPHHDRFVLKSQSATRPRDVRRAMLEYKPQVVHFCGQGEGEQGLVLEDDETGKAKLVSTEALANLFELFADQVECVLLNACYSQVQAEAIAQHIPYVIGMSQKIGDRAAIEFAVGFYDALGAGRDTEFAFNLGCNAIRMAGMAEHLIPILKKKLGVKPIIPEAGTFCPYRGLLSFTENDADFFYGRDNLIKELFEKLKYSQLIAVVGISGSGKSSLVQAGIIPRLEKNIRGWRNCQVIKLRPGTDPQQTLMNALSNLFQFLLSANSLESSELFWTDVQQALQSQPFQLLIYIDQFEELFSFCPAKVQKDFTEDLLKLIESSQNLKIILTIRSEFYYHLLNSYLGDQPKIVVQPMQDEELRQAITQPANRVGLELEPGLTDLIIQDLEGINNPLPLLQLALEQLWQNEHQNNFLTREGYRKLKGVAGVITRWADASYYTLKTSKEKDLTRRILIRLVYQGKSDLPATRQRILQSDLIRSSDNAVIHQLINALVSKRILTIDTDSKTKEYAVEIVHETLLQEWLLLREWLTESKKNLIQRDRIESAAADWKDRKKPKEIGYLLQGSNLLEAERLAQDTSTDGLGFFLSNIALEFIRTSRAVSQKQQIQKFSLSAIMLLVVVVAGGIGWNSWKQQQRFPALDAAKNNQVKPRQLEFAEEDISWANQLVSQGQIEEAMVKYREAITFASPSYSENPKAKQISDKAENLLVDLIKKSALEDLKNILKTPKFSVDDATLLTRKILLSDTGANLDLTPDGTPRSPTKFDRIPCSLLKEIQQAWQNIDAQCAWYSLQKTPEGKNYVNGYSDPNCSTLKEKTLSFTVFPQEFYTTASDRLLHCHLIPEPLQ